MNPKAINYLALTLVGATILTSCGGEEPNSIQKLVSERDSLREVREVAEARIIEINALLSEMDSVSEKILVTTFQPDTGTFKHFFEVYGNIDTDKAATLYAENPGIVQQILVSEGDQVRKGQLLVKLDSEILASNITELRTQLELATTLYEKQKRLWEQNVGSEVQYLEAKNRKESLENSIATLQEQTNKSTIRAPFDGVVDKIFPKTGEMASGASPIARIVNLDNVYVTAEVSERYVGKVKGGDEVSVIINRSDTIQTTISRVGSFINPNNRTFEVKILLSGKVANVKPNTLVVLKINDFSATQSISIPSSLIMQDGQGQDYVFVVETNGANKLVARKKAIDSGMRYLGETLIKNGLTTSQPIIDKGSRSVRDGDQIEVTNI